MFIVGHIAQIMVLGLLKMQPIESITFLLMVYQAERLSTNMLKKSYFPCAIFSHSWDNIWNNFRKYDLVSLMKDIYYTVAPFYPNYQCK